MEVQMTSSQSVAPIPVASAEPVPQVLPAATEFYLKQLCGINGVSYDGLDKSKYFSVSDRKEINKIFFAGLTAPPKVELASSQRKALRDMFARRADSSNRLRDNMNQRLVYYQEAERNMQQRLADYISSKRAYEAALATHDSLSLVYPIEKLLSEGRVLLHSVSGAEGYVEFTTVNDCIVKHKNEAAKVYITVNLGKFKLVVDISRNKVYVRKHMGNTEVDGYFHPHVAGDGSVCWGNARDAISAALEQCDVYKIVNTLLILLSEYNDESPYVSLAQIHALIDWEYKGDIHVLKRFLLDAGINGLFEAHDDYNLSVYGSVYAVYIGSLYKHKVSGVHGFMTVDGEVKEVPSGTQWKDSYYEADEEVEGL